MVGFKPTQGRCPDLGRYSVPYGQQAISSQVGVLARQVEDVEPALRAINASGDPAQDGSFALPASEGVRVGGLACMRRTPPSLLRLRCNGRLQRARSCCVALVWKWSSGRPPDPRRAEALLFGIFTSGARHYKELLAGDPRDPRVAQLITLSNLSHRIAGFLGSLLRALGQRSLGRGLALFGRRSTEAYWQLAEAVQDYRRDFRQALENGPGGRLDAFLSPATGLPAVPHGASTELGVIGAYTLLQSVGRAASVAARFM